MTNDPLKSMQSNTNNDPRAGKNRLRHSGLSLTTWGGLVLLFVATFACPAQASTPVPVQLAGIGSFDLTVHVWDLTSHSLENRSALETKFARRSRELLESIEISVLEEFAYPRLLVEVTLYSEHATGPIAVLASIQVCDEVELSRDIDGKIPGGCAVTWQNRLLGIAESPDQVPSSAEEVLEETLQALLDALTSVR